jgi:DNA ligase (NAD+)
MFDQKKMQDFTDKYLQRVKDKPVSSLKPKEIATCYTSIIEVIGYHNWLYYIKSQPIIGDGQYDQLFEYLREIEALHPDIISPDSPTQRLSYQLQDEFTQAQHPIPLLSLENSYNAQDL